MESIFFWLFASGMLLGGLSVVVNRNPVASALSLVVTIVFMAGLYVLLHAYFLAALQVVVYAGAVMVLFLFVIMLLDIKAVTDRPVRVVALGVGTILSAGFFILLLRVIRLLPSNQTLNSPLPDSVKSDVSVIGTELFTKYLLPFEVTSVLLLVATVGVILLSKREAK